MFLRRHHHDHLPTFHLRHLFDGAVLLQVITDPFEKICTQFLVRHLAPPEPERYLGLVPALEESHELAQLDLVVAFVRPGTKLDFLNVNLLLFAL